MLPIILLLLLLIINIYITYTVNIEEIRNWLSYLSFCVLLMHCYEIQRQARRFLAEGQVENYQQAEVAVSLLSLKFTSAEALKAAKECHNLDAAIAYLQQDCELCAGKYAANEVST